MNFRPKLCLLAVAVASAAPAAAERAPAPPHPQTVPSLELGVGAVVLTVPDYRGSDYYDVQALPIPYVVYHSDHLQLSREGLRARIFTVDRLSLSVSAALNLTSRRDNPDRRGMPQLKPSLEVGPSLDYRVDEGDHWSVRARLPVRGTISADGARWIGAVLAPHFRYDLDQKLGSTDLYYLATIGGLWSSSEYNQYFYGVAPQYIAPGRGPYEARSGYGGMHATLSATWRIDKWRVGAFLSNDYLAGAAFDDSPLVKTDDNVAGGFLVAYRLYSRGREFLRDDDSP
jgi:outer membrane scaffolding protein for murein synthesis (MipA/OmpV family)